MIKRYFLFVATLFIVFGTTRLEAQWTKASATFHASFFYPWNGDSVFAISSGKLFLSPDQGATWTQSLVTPNVQTMVSSSNGILYAATNDQVYKSIDAGANWIMLTTTGKPPAITGFYARSISSTTDELFLGAKDGMYKTTTDALDWVDVSEEVNVKEFASSGDKLYACSPASILRSVDGGNTWKIVDSTTVSFTGFAVSGNNVFAMISTPPGGSVDHSVDGGDNWLGPLYFSLGSASFNKMATNNWGDVYISGGIRSDANPDSIAQGYVYRWLNGAAAWEFYNTGLPAADLVGLGFGYKGRVYVSTDSAGIYKTLEALQQVKQVNDNLAISETYPNPAAETFSVQIDSKEQSQALFELYDLRGFLRSSIHSQLLHTGLNTVTLDPGQLANGMYLLRIVISGEVITRTVTINR